jgi:hypothetical protein
MRTSSALKSRSRKQAADFIKLTFAGLRRLASVMSNVKLYPAS